MRSQLYSINIIPPKARAWAAWPNQISCPRTYGWATAIEQLAWFTRQSFVGHTILANLLWCNAQWPQVMYHTIRRCNKVSVEGKIISTVTMSENTPGTHLKHICTWECLKMALLKNSQSSPVHQFSQQVGPVYQSDQSTSPVYQSPVQSTSPVYQSDQSDQSTSPVHQSDQSTSPVHQSSQTIHAYKKCWCEKCFPWLWIKCLIFGTHANACYKSLSGRREPPMILSWTLMKSLLMIHNCP